MARGERLKGDAQVGHVMVYQWLPCSYTHQDPKSAEGLYWYQMSELMRAQATAAPDWDLKKGPKGSHVESRQLID